MPRNDRKAALIEGLERLIGEAPGVETPWQMMAIVFRQYVPPRHLNALKYRIECAIRQSFDEGLRKGHSMGSRGEPLP